MILQYSDRRRQQRNRANKSRKNGEEETPGGGENHAMDPARLEEAALAQAAKYGGSDHKKAARMARLAGAANPELELIRHG